jgi:hypothetical protein
MVLASLVLASVAVPRSTWAKPQDDKDYLTAAEADKIRDANDPGMRIELYMSFAEDRLMKFDYELHRSVAERRRDDILNGLLNGYVGCVDDAADQIAVAQDRHINIREALKKMETKDKEFLDILQKYEMSGPNLDVYKDTLDDAIEGTKDAISDTINAEKEMQPGPVRRKQE